VNQTKTNIIANFAGRFVTAILSIIFVPIYLRYLSVEMYGIIGFFASIQAFLVLLDGGISPTLNREVARLSVFPDKAQELRDLSRTLEVLCWMTGFIVCIIALIASPAAATYWLKSENIPIEVIREALMIMSVTFAFQWALGFYTGGLYGLQEQKSLNTINIFLAVIRSFGTLFILAFVSPTIKAFLIWQLITTIVNCFLLVLFFWRRLPKTSEKPRFNVGLLKEVWRYAAGMAGTSLVVLILTQTDKIILSKLLTLEDFGYYSLATMLAGTGIGMIVGSIQTTYFPQFSQLVAQNKINELRELYHRSCQVMSFFLIPIVSILAFFSYEILLVWTRKPEIAEKTYVLLTLVAIALGINGLMHLPYYAQLAFGITKIGFWLNVIAIILIVPLMIYATLHYGAVGGASSSVILHLSSAIFGMQVMHRLILQGELKKWYLEDTVIPILIVIIFLFFSKQLINLTEVTTFHIIATVGILFLIVTFITALTLPKIRNSFSYHLRKSLTRLNYEI
jgi:O-antigen/teichoic acid export membrane protein